MKSVKISLCGLLVMLSSLCFPTGALAQTEAKLAEWTFASGYDKTDVDGKTVYVPNSNEWAEISTPIRDKIAISCMLRQIHEFSSHAIRHGLYIKNRKRLFCP